MNLQKVAVQLTEHYDSVVIIATKYTAVDSETILDSAKAGNHYARQASVEDYVEGTRQIWVYEEDGDEEDEAN